MPTEYRAFLSYSHKDTALAEEWHARLEALPIDLKLVGQPAKYGPVPGTLQPIFRDRLDYPASGSLSALTLQALEQSGALIVLATPNAAASPWVNEEVRLFRHLYPHRPPPIAILFADDGVAPIDCFPPALRFMLDDTGAVTSDPYTHLATDPRRDGMARACAKILADLVGLEPIQVEPRIAAYLQDAALAGVRHGEVTDRLDTFSKRLDAFMEASGVVKRAEDAGLERETILRIAARIRPNENLSFEQAVIEVEHAVTIALPAIARGERGGNLDTFVETVLARLAETTRAGRFDEGSRNVDAALRELDQREAENRATERRSRIAMLEAGEVQDTLRRDAPAVARRIEALVALDNPTRPAWSPVFRQRWDTSYEEGRDKGLAFPLEVATALACRMLATAKTPDERGNAGNLLGSALATLGARESGTARLGQAAAAYGAALEEYTRDRVPLNWAMTQNNLGNALRRLGERESGIARLEEAVAAYRFALEERTRDRVPLDWAMTQNNLGNALRRLGERESGIARLDEAVAAYRFALEEYIRDRVPLDWAMTQNNLGNALLTLGERESGTARLLEAVAAYRAALEERTRDRVPLGWATTQYNLAIAQSALAERTHDRRRMAEAIASMRNAAEVYRQGNVTYWLPIAEQRIAAMEAALAKMPP